MTKRLTGLGEALVALAGPVVAGAMVFAARPGWTWVGIVVGVALALGSLPMLVVRSLRRDGALTEPAMSAAGSTAPASWPSQPELRWTTLVRFGDEPVGVARATVQLAGRVGPVIVVSERAVPDGLAVPGVEVVQGPNLAEAMAEAVRRVSTRAVLMTSARAVPDVDACRDAASRLGGSIAWVVGRSEPIGGASRADRRSLVGERIRAGARRMGLWTWEPDAVMLDAVLLAERPVAAGEPWGRWLRSRAAEGRDGGTSERCLTHRTEPGSGASYWAYSIARRRALVADLVDSVRTGRGRSRRLAVGLLARELDALALVAVSVGWWTIVLTGEVPWDRTPLMAAMAVALGGSRYLLVRRATDVAPLPLADLRSTVAGVPSSVFAVVAVSRPRLMDARRPAPARPLVWVALGLTLLTGVGLVDHAAGDAPSLASVSMSVVTLLALWAFAIRSVVERSWQRSAFRVGVDVAVRLSGVAGRAADASVHGLSVRLVPGSPVPDPGESVALEVETAPGTWWSTTGRVVSRRRRSSGTVVGVALSQGGGDDGWLDLLLSAVSTAGHGPVPVRGSVAFEPVVVPTRRRWADVALVASGVGVSVLVVGALSLVLAGYQPLVIRSASMTPTLRIGDLTVVEPVRASNVQPGQIVTRPPSAQWGESLTHRVRVVRAVGGGLEVTTQGDANPESETWRVSRAAWLGRSVWSVPAVGAPTLLLRSAWLRWGLGVVSVAAAVWFARRRPISSRRASVAS